MLNKCPIFEIWRNRTRKKIGCNNVKLWLDRNIFKPSYKKMTAHKIQLIRSLGSTFCKYAKPFELGNAIKEAFVNNFIYKGFPLNNINLI
jgi:hypothetical protein